MIIKKSDTPIVCDIGGCGKMAEFFIKKDEKSSDYYSLKLCRDCATEIKNLLVKELRKKEN
ncbi:MAG: hypothetical protein IJA97_01390 [Clostridia bacterium]|nr:hypothetical protein [Clostridia bacterium]